MRNNKFWFTFIEVVVVVSIFAVIWIFWLTSLNKNFMEQNLNSEVSLLNQKIDNFNDNIWNSISDYKIFINTGSFYYYYTNLLYSSKNQKILFNWWTWVISTNDTNMNDWQVNIYYNDKKVYSNMLSSTWTLQYLFSKTWSYLIKSYIWSEKINEIWVDYFSKFDNKLINLIDISWTWITNTWFYITNRIWGFYEKYTNWWTFVNNQINLKFEKDEVNTNLIIK